MSNQNYPIAEALLEAAVEVRRAAWLAASGRLSLDTVIDGLSDVFPYDEVLLSRWDADAGAHRTVLDSGTGSTARFVDSEQFSDPLVAQVRRSRQSLWLSNLTAAQWRDSTTVQKVIAPLGFTEGITQCLYSTEGHYVGILNIGTHRPPTDARSGATRTDPRVRRPRRQLDFAPGQIGRGF